jgi:hypothetical protein
LNDKLDRLSLAILRLRVVCLTNTLAYSKISIIKEIDDDFPLETLRVLIQSPTSEINTNYLITHVFFTVAQSYKTFFCRNLRFRNNKLARCKKSTVILIFVSNTEPTKVSNSAQPYPKMSDKARSVAIVKHIRLIG